MTVTLTSKDQITIPLAVRQQLNLKTRDALEFDETAPVLTRRVVNRAEWERTLEAWQVSAESALTGHPWEKQSAADIIDDLRGGSAETPAKAR